MEDLLSEGPPWVLPLGVYPLVETLQLGFNLLFQSCNIKTLVCPMRRDCTKAFDDSNKQSLQDKEMKQILNLNPVSVIEFIPTLIVENGKCEDFQFRGHVYTAQITPNKYVASGYIFQVVIDHVHHGYGMKNVWSKSDVRAELEKYILTEMINDLWEKELATFKFSYKQFSPEVFSIIDKLEREFKKQLLS